jgi:ABC-type antimicrobial peptide transport system permease subunit
MLVGVTPLDPLTFAIMTAAFLGIGAAAAWLPAARAARMDVTEALREE